MVFVWGNVEIWQSLAAHSVYASYYWRSTGMSDASRGVLWGVNRIL